MNDSAVLTLDVLKPAAGGRMLARSNTGVVLVAGAVPGERVRARVERVGKGVTFADVVEVLDPSPDRLDVTSDWRCGGMALAHVRYPRQLAIKAEIIADAFSRIAKLPLAEKPFVMGSPERGYRMRARLHAASGRLGFYREGTHEVCDPAPSGQLTDDALAWIGAAGRALGPEAFAGLGEVELVESVDGRERACHLSLREGADARRYAPLGDGLVGLSAQSGDHALTTVSGRPVIADVLEHLTPAAAPLRLARQARAFFQSNRFLLRPLVEQVLAAVRPGPLLDLYAGVGLFGLSLAAAGHEHVTLVEGDPVSAADLDGNARPWSARVRVVRRNVESFLGSASLADATHATIIVDPPRTGLSKDAMAGVRRLAAGTVVYVSCDVATLARDARALVDADYALDSLTGLDLFPNTAHVESVAVFRRH